MIRQQILRLRLGARSLDGPCTDWTFHDPTDGTGPSLPGGDPPYATGFDALRDGWFLLAVVSSSADEASAVDHLFERRVTVGRGESAADPIVVGPSRLHGRGVFATRDIAAGEVVHVAPVLLLDDHDFEQVAGTPFDGHLYDWEEGGAAFALGVGSVFNHATPSNLHYERADDEHPSAPAHVYIARREIAVGEELTIDYVEGDEAHLWFDPSA